MDESTALEIVMKLVDGVDPRTEKKLPPESPYQDAETIRALFTAVLALKYQQKYKHKDPDKGADKNTATDSATDSATDAGEEAVGGPGSVTPKRS